MKAKVKKILLLAIPALLFSFTALANDANIPINEYDSIYKYGALENKVFFVYTKDEIISPVEKELQITQEVNLNAEKLKDITKKQAESIKKSEDSMRVIENANGIKSFLVGNNLGALRFQIVQMKDLRYNLNILVSKTDSDDIKVQINSQIETLSKEEEKVENFILQTDSKFSLFGWLVASI